LVIIRKKNRSVKRPLEEGGFFIYASYSSFFTVGAENVLLFIRDLDKILAVPMISTYAFRVNRMKERKTGH